MTSQKSQNKLTLLRLMREDLKHRRWMLVLSSFVQIFLGPIAVLFAFSEMEQQYYYPIDDPNGAYRAMLRAVASVSKSYLPLIMIVIAIVGALIVGIGGYRHLFNRKMTDMVNSLPVTRGKQFDSIYFNNWLIWLVPQVLSLILCMVIMLFKAAPYGLTSMIMSSMLFILIGAALCFACMMNMVILAVVLSGSIFNALLNVVFIGFDLIVIYFTIDLMCTACFDTYVQLPLFASDICWVSAPSSGAYFGTLIGKGIFLQSSEEIVNRFGSVTAFYLALAATIIVAIVNLVIAYSIYVKRKSEDSETGISNKVYGLCIRCINSVLGGLFTAELINELLYMRNGSLKIWQLFFAAVASAVVFGVIDMIHGRSFKGFFSHWKQMIAVVLATEAILVTFLYDLMGYDKRIISESSIDTAMVEVYLYGMGTDGSGYIKDPEREGMLIDKEIVYGFNREDYYIEIPAHLAYKLMTARRVLWKDYDRYIFDPVTRRTEEYVENGNRYYYENVNIVVDRKVGFDFARSYNIYDKEVLEELINVPGFMEQAFPFRSGELGCPRRIWVSDRMGNRRDIEIPPELMEEVFDTSVQDFKDNYSYDYIGMVDRDVVYCLECEYYIEQRYAGDEDSYWINTMLLYLSEDDVRTIELLDELGFEDYKYLPDDMDEYGWG